MAKKSPDLEFASCVPEHLQEDVLTRLCETAHDPDYKAPDISIIDRYHIDGLNVEMIGAIQIEGVEHSFHIRDGNNNGTEILGWSMNVSPEITSNLALG